MAEEKANPSVALIMGVTGMVGISLAESLKKPSALGGPWKVYGAARRPIPDWFPSSSTMDRFISVNALDSADTQRSLSPLAGEVTHLFWVAIQVRETEEQNITVNSIMLSNVLNALLLPSSSSTSSRGLQHVTLQTGTKHYMGPIFDPVLGKQLVHQDPPFREDGPRLPYPNFYYALEDLLDSFSKTFAFRYSIHRSSIIVGASTRSVYNALFSLAAYATICKYQGLPFKYPGNKYTWHHFCDMSDALVLAKQHIWASVTERAKNQAFNCTNGDVFTWKSLWRVLCEVFELEFVPYVEEEADEFDFVGMMKGKGKVWDEIVEKYGLFESKLEGSGLFEALDVVLHFEFQHVSDMNKNREFGFYQCVDTAKGIRFWVSRMREMKIIP